MVCDLHQDLFARLPEADRLLPDGKQTLQPGALRSRQVSVGRHAAPAANSLPAFLARWGGFYSQVRRGEMQVLAMAAAHHRLAWIHPFPDGNGRVARLHTHLLLGHLGLTNGLWLSQSVADQFHLYRLFQFRSTPKLFDLPGPLDRHCFLDPVSYKASFS